MALVGFKQQLQLGAAAAFQICSPKIPAMLPKVHNRALTVRLKGPSSLRPPPKVAEQGEIWAETPDALGRACADLWAGLDLVRQGSGGICKHLENRKRKFRAQTLNPLVVSMFFCIIPVFLHNPNASKLLGCQSLELLRNNSRKN